MRILLLSQWCHPEPAELLTDMAESLQVAGHQVTILTGFPNFPSGKIYPGYRLKLFQKETIKGIQVIRVPLFPDHSKSAIWRSLNILSFAFSAALLGLWLVPRVDVVHVIHPPLSVGVPAWILSRFFRVPFTYEIQDMWPETLEATGMLRNKRALGMLGSFAKWVYRRAAAIRVISPGFKANLIAKGVPEEKIHVISNWVNTDEFVPVNPDPQIGEEHGLSGRFNILYTGMIGPAQGIDTVLDAAERLRDLPKAQFVLVGDGTDSEQLMESASQRRLNNAKFLGRLPQSAMCDLYAWADVLLVNLRDDPLFRITIPHKTFVYMAAEKPILAAAEGDVADIILSSGSGLSCRPGDPVAIADAVRQFVAMSREQRQEMGRNGRHAATEQYGRENAVMRIGRMMETVVDNKAVRTNNDSRVKSNSESITERIFVP